MRLQPEVLGGAELLDRAEPDPASDPTLMLAGLNVDQPDTAMAPDAVRGDALLVQEAGQVRPGHAQHLRRLGRGVDGWVYFHFAADAMRHALATAKIQLDITRLVLSYGHLAFIAVIIAVAVGLREAVAASGHPLSWAFTGLLYSGTSLYLASFGYTRWAMFRLVSRTRLSAAAAVLVLLPLGHHVPTLAALLILVGVLAALNAFELNVDARIGWRARGR